MKTYLCKEGRETFTIKAKDRNEAEELAQIYNAIVIKQLKSTKTN